MVAFAEATNIVSHKEVGISDENPSMFLLKHTLHSLMSTGGTVTGDRVSPAAVSGPAESFTYCLHPCEAETAGGRKEIWVEKV